MLKSTFLLIALLGKALGQEPLTISSTLPTPLPPAGTDEPTFSPTASPSAAPSISSAPTETCYNVEIGLIFDKYPDETRWEIVKGRRPSFQNNNAELVKESPFYDPKPPGNYRGATEKHIVCLPEGRYTFTIMDRERDGMCCGDGEGRYVVTYQSTGDMIAQGSEFGYFESTTFSVPYKQPAFKDNDADGRDDTTKNVYPPLVYPCVNKLGINVKTDDYGVETTFELWTRSNTEDYTDGTLVASGGPYTSDHEYNLSYCLNPGKYTFVLLDWACDGLSGTTVDGSYTLDVNGVEVYEGPQTWADEGQYYELVKLEFTNGIGDELKSGSSEARLNKEYGVFSMALVTFSAMIMAWI
mmetsp:Transcript_32402/g.47760  ORF Transcript_32402/g.47760 Transcript_32402/m.47760 type:complete len:355 (-) Transcript_32402:174-1238(-)